MSGLALLLIGLGIVLVILAWLLLRRGGQEWRIGRLLAVAAQRSLAEAAALAARGEDAYVRIHGRIDSDEEFPGDDGAPLVFRRRRLQRAQRRSLGATSWRTFDDQRLAVPFGLAERGQRIAIDVEALGDGLVVVPGIATGVAADLEALADGGAGDDAADRVPTTIPPMEPDQPVRLRVEQVAATDHGTAAGVPRLAPDGGTVLGPGLGRPLILTTLDLDEAMRVLGADRRSALVAATILLAAAALLLSSGVVAALAGW